MNSRVMGECLLREPNGNFDFYYASRKDRAYPAPVDHRTSCMRRGRFCASLILRATADPIEFTFYIVD